MGLFDKKYCDICGEKIGLLGNRKLEDGNLCKDCAKKLSYWFDERRHSTVAQIKSQLDYREENRKRVAQFHVTRSFGENWKVLIDEPNRCFTVTGARDLQEANPDIVDFSALTGCRLDIDEHRTELMRQDKEGKRVSYVPPRYEYSYDFDIIITVNHPYFDEMHFRLNPDSVTIQTGGMSTDSRFNRPMTASRAAVFDPSRNAQYRQYQQMGEEICQTMEACRRMRDGAAPASDCEPAFEPSAPAAPASAAGPWTCPACGGKNDGKFCEYCGTPRP